jgi:hypothetical protein
MLPKSNTDDITLSRAVNKTVFDWFTDAKKKYKYIFIIYSIKKKMSNVSKYITVLLYTVHV